MYKQDNNALLSAMASFGLMAGLAVGLMASASPARASGFALIEQSASGQGNAFAGAAVSATDASTLFFNPAGMSKISGRQLVLAAHYIDASGKFHNQGSGLAGTKLPLAGNNDDGGDRGFVPNFYYVADLTENVKYGIGLFAPFGLSTEYDDHWVGRYHALKSEVKTVNLNPAVSWKINERVSAGIGLNIQYAEATLSNAVDFGAVCAGLADANTCGSIGLTPQRADGKAELTGDDISFGYNLGVILDATDADHIGLAYRSEINHSLEGDASFEAPAAFRAMLAAQQSPVSRLFSDTAISADLDLPASLSLSYAHDFGAKLTLLADVTRTFWSSFKELRVSFANPVQPETVVDESWDDANRYSLGVTYQFSDKLVLRGGIALDETPIPDDAHRTARIPGSDRRWVSVGAGYKFSKNASIDFGYSHLTFDDAAIHSLESSPRVYLLNGSYDSDADIVSVQGTWRF